MSHVSYFIKRFKSHFYVSHLPKHTNAANLSPGLIILLFSPLQARTTCPEANPCRLSIMVIAWHMTVRRYRFTMSFPIIKFTPHPPPRRTLRWWHLQQLVWHWEVSQSGILRLQPMSAWSRGPRACKALSTGCNRVSDFVSCRFLSQ